MHLVDILGDDFKGDTVKINYQNYETKTVLRYGAELIGGESLSSINPAKITSIPKLTQMHTMLKNGDMKWRKLSEGELRARRELAAEDSEDGMDD